MTSRWTRRPSCASPIRSATSSGRGPRWRARCATMVEWQERGADRRRLRQQPAHRGRTAGFARAFDYPGFVPAYVRPLFCRGIGPFRWAALSGDPDDIAATDAAMRELFPENGKLQRWLDGAQERIAFQGLPARICWIGYGERHRAGLRFNELVRSGEVTAPIVIGRDHLDSGSVASPYRETEAMKRRLRRDRRLADPERDAQRRLGRGLGRAAPRRRRRHRPVDPHRRAGRRRRHRRGRAAARARAHERSRARASCDTPTPATTRRSSTRGPRGLDLPMLP